MSVDISGPTKGAMPGNREGASDGPSWRPIHSRTRQICAGKTLQTQCRGPQRPFRNFDEPVGIPRRHLCTCPGSEECATSLGDYRGLSTTGREVGRHIYEFCHLTIWLGAMARPCFVSARRAADWPPPAGEQRRPPVFFVGIGGAIIRRTILMMTIMTIITVLIIALLITNDIKDTTMRKSTITITAILIMPT